MEAQMAAKESLLIHPEEINPTRRPKLTEMLSIVDGYAYLLSSESLSTDPEDTRLLIFVMSPGTCGLIEDSPAHENGEDEYYHATVLDDVSIISLRSLISPPPRIRKESTGRPPKYKLEKDGQEIFMRHVYEGTSIKSIAKERRMSPTTVQKFLNRYRSQIVEQILSGEWVISPNSPDFKQDLSVLKWGLKHTQGEEQAKLQEILAELKKAADTLPPKAITPKEPEPTDEQTPTPPSPPDKVNEDSAQEPMPVESPLNDLNEETAPETLETNQPPTVKDEEPPLELETP